MREQIVQIRAEALASIDKAEDLNCLNDVRIAYLGKKGALTAVLKGMKDVDPAERPVIGELVNDARAEIDAALEEKKHAMEAAALEERLQQEVIDVTLPARSPEIGHRHPNTIALDEVERIFVGLGYEVVEGPEIEYDYYNFEALNIPANHPAKDEQDTFYITDDVLLRTQT